MTSATPAVGSTASVRNHAAPCHCWLRSCRQTAAAAPCTRAPVCTWCRCPLSIRSTRSASAASAAAGAVGTGWPGWPELVRPKRMQHASPASRAAAAPQLCQGPPPAGFSRMCSPYSTTVSAPMISAGTCCCCCCAAAPPPPAAAASAASLRATSCALCSAVRRAYSAALTLSLGSVSSKLLTTTCGAVHRAAAAAAAAAQWARGRCCNAWRPHTGRNHCCTRAKHYPNGAGAAAHIKLEAHLLQQLAAARRGGGQHDAVALQPRQVLQQHGAGGSSPGGCGAASGGQGAAKGSGERARQVHSAVRGLVARWGSLDATNDVCASSA